MKIEKVIEQMTPSKKDLEILLQETLHVDISRLEEEGDIAIYARISATLALIISSLKKGVNLNIDRRELVYKGVKPSITMLAFARALCRLAEPEIGELSTRRLIQEIGSPE